MPWSDAFAFSGLMSTICVIALAALRVYEREAIRRGGYVPTAEEIRDAVMKSVARHRNSYQDNRLVDLVSADTINAVVALVHCKREEP